MALNWQGIADLIGKSFGGSYAAGTEQGINQKEKENELLLRQKLAEEQELNALQNKNKYLGNQLAEYYINSQGKNNTVNNTGLLQRQQQPSINPLMQNVSLGNYSLMDNANKQVNSGLMAGLQGNANNNGYMANIFEQTNKPISIQEALQSYAGNTYNPFLDMNIESSNITPEQQNLVDLARSGNTFAINKLQKEMTPMEWQVGTREVFDPKTNLTKQETYIYGVDDDGNYSEQIVSDNITGKDWTTYKAEQERELAEAKRIADYNKFLAEQQALDRRAKEKNQATIDAAKIKAEGSKRSNEPGTLNADKYNELVILNEDTLKKYPKLAYIGADMRKNGQSDMIQTIFKYGPADLKPLPKKSWYQTENGYKEEYNAIKKENENVKYARDYLKQNYNYDPFVDKAIPIIENQGITVTQNNDGSYTLTNINGDTYTATQEELAEEYISTFQ